ncbi:Mitochondrial carrier domain-containing protein [Orpheovirus IHUMI-LCC2]|uniref:Mitochondrial carrier domain-containing protein n=1 Tax=Orpheovirus IHUMI-LCC2 TaxID=2023057 RepID=A0A2I2L5B0_9VIRU|nr:Mitochondrial carrier domain-containing protein [Orpheovirus IHUMI-LCC2]SNW62690.1 Mitochondrial carrier domain-containing protein [Orpheovirus IHUMI-LCC2]
MWIIYLQTAISAFFASFLSSTLTYPIYTFYTRSVSKYNVPNISMYSSFLHHLSNGISNIYAGYIMYLISTVFSQTIYYYFYSLFSYSSLSYIHPSFLAAILSVLFSTPLWVLNSKLSTSLYSLSYLIYTMRISDYYAGVIPSLILTINPSITYILYENLMYIMDEYKFSIIICSFVSKLIASFLTYPLVYIKVNNQINPYNIIRKWKKEGIYSLYCGIQTKLIHSLFTFVLLVYFQHIIYILLQSN